MTASLLTGPRFRAPVPGALVYVYYAGGSTEAPTWNNQSMAGGTENTFPVVCDPNGQAIIWTEAVAHRVVVTDPDGVPISDDDNVPSEISGALLSASGGSSLLGFTQAGAGAVARTTQDKLRDVVNVKDFGALSTNTAAVNKTCLQLAITAYAALGGTIIVPWDISIGHIMTDKATWPSFAGVTKPMTVIDYGPGASYAGFPAAYDGSQVRHWAFTPQTTVLGSHDGNTQWLRGAWAPFIGISNDMDLSGARLASDNRRAGYLLYSNGQNNWLIGQGSQSGAGFTDEQLGNFYIQKYEAFNTFACTAALLITATSATLVKAWPTMSGTYRATFSNGDTRTVTLTAGATTMTWAGGLSAAATALVTISLDTLGPYVPYLVERETGRIAYGIGTNAPIAAHDFGPCNTAETLPTMVVRTGNATADIHVQSTSGALNRTYIKNVSGETRIGNTAVGGGDAIKIKNDSAYLEFGTGSAYTFSFNFQDTRASQFVHLVNNKSATDGFVQKLQSTATQAATWSFLEGYANAGADKRIVIAGTGNITNTNNSYGAISDKRLKRDITVAGSSWGDFKAYRFRKFRFKKEPEAPLQLGVIAQELQKVSPGLVDKGADGMLEVKYSVLYLKACVALQEAMKRIEALEAKVGN